MTGPACLARGLGLLTASVVGTAGTWWLVRDRLLLPLRTWSGTALDFDDALAALCSGVLLGCVLWLAVGTALAVLATAARRLAPRTVAARAFERLTERACPALLRRIVTSVLGVAMTTAVTGPVVADSPPSAADPRSALSGLPLPDRAAGRGLDAAARATVKPATEPVVVVAPGDSLWSLAADRLPATAGDAALSRAWRLLYRTNLRTIGRDPDVILPGARLVVPRLTHLAPDRKDLP